MFIVVSGLSASGKNTIMNHLIQRRKDLKVLKHSSCTTREPRESDSEFQTYTYLTEEEFLEKARNNEFVEYENVHGNYYGVVKSALDKTISDDEYDYIRDIDVKGNLSLKKYFENKGQIVSIFLDAPDEVLRQRLLARGDKPEKIEVRLSRGPLERSYKKYYDLVIDNIEIEKTLETIDKFLNSVKK